MTLGADNSLPPGWAPTLLGEACHVNPRAYVREPYGDTIVSFVPMAAVEAGTGCVDVSQTRLFKDVRQGYTRFSDGDVLFAKITPCMENGKVAAVTGLKNGSGAGSTEFHVLRPIGGISGKLVMYYVSMDEFRRAARQVMTGTAGQLRVPQRFVEEALLPLPPLPEQHRIVMEIEKQLTRLDAAIAALNRARTKLKRYRASVLKAACEGRLVPTEAELACREGRKYEHACILLDHIEAAAERCRIEKGKSRPVIGDSKPAETPRLSSLPDGWTWSTLSQLMDSLKNGYSKRPGATEGIAILRISAVRPMSVDADDIRYVQDDPEDLRGFFIRPGDLLFTRYNGNPQFVGVCGVVGQLNRPTIHPDKLIRVCLILGEPLPAWVEIAANNGASRDHIASRIRTTAGQSGISGGDLRTMPLPLPPTNEQLRIVAEVGRLLSRVQATEQTIEASLKRADRLRQAVLKHAFEGKLVPQDSTDEPASVLLERIKAEWASVEGDSERRKSVRRRPVGRKAKSAKRAVRT